MEIASLPLHLFFGPAAAAAGAAVVLAWRFRETHRPVTVRSIVAPPLAMASGFVMFALPAMRVPLSWAVVALLVGALLLSSILERMSRLERVGDHIMMRRSRAFLVVLVVLAGSRIALHDYLDHLISPLQSASLCYLLAFGMIALWRLRMLLQYRRLTRSVAARVEAVTAGSPV
jgi:membrane protein CcdC involved in cytochrome C biogenesis